MDTLILALLAVVLTIVVGFAIYATILARHILKGINGILSVGLPRYNEKLDDGEELGGDKEESREGEEG